MEAEPKPVPKPRKARKSRKQAKAQAVPGDIATQLEKLTETVAADLAIELPKPKGPKPPPPDPGIRGSGGTIHYYREQAKRSRALRLTGLIVGAVSTAAAVTGIIATAVINAERRQRAKGKKKRK